MYSTVSLRDSGRDSHRFREGFVSVITCNSNMCEVCSFIRHNFNVEVRVVCIEFFMINHLFLFLFFTSTCHFAVVY